MLVKIILERGKGMPQSNSKEKIQSFNKNCHSNAGLALKIIPHYAGSHGEVFSAIQYVRYGLNFYKLGDTERANALLQIAFSELEHACALVKVLKKMGYSKRELQELVCSNDFYYYAEKNSKQTPKAMLLDLLICEMSCIREYKNTIKKIKDQPTLDVLNEIIVQEETHVQTIKDLVFLT